MKSNSRFPTRYTVQAALAGLIALGGPYLILPFLRSFPFYPAPPYKINLIGLTLSYTLAWVAAAGICLSGLKRLSNRWGIEPDMVLTYREVVTVLLAAAAGGAFAALFGFLTGFSPLGRSTMSVLGVGAEALDKGPEPFLSIGIAIGTALAVLLAGLFSGLSIQPVSARGSQVQGSFGLAAKIFVLALLCRWMVYMIEFSSIATYSTFGQSFLFFMLVQAAGGALISALIWKRLKALSKS